MNIGIILQYILHPSWVLIFLDNRGFIRIKDDTYLKILYKKNTGEKLNLENPESFNEKLQWLKLYDRKPEYTMMVDKYEVKKYISDVLGEKYVIPTIGVYDKFDDIDFSKITEKFVIKCTHDSGGVIICNNKEEINIDDIKNKIEKNLSNNYYYPGREWPYKNVKPRIIIEKYMIDKEVNELRDYKFFSFNGKVKFFKIDFNRYTKHQANYYDTDGNLLKFGEQVCPPDYNKKLKFPVNLGLMIKMAEKLSKNIPFVRVDFYEVNKKVFFGELTFYPAAGFGKFIPHEMDLKLGKELELPKVKRK